MTSTCFAGLNNIIEQDGSPSVFPWKLKVSNGTLTDNGDGSASLTTGGGSGTPGTPVNSVQFNSSSAFAGDTSFSWNSDLNRLGISRDVGQTGIAIVISSDTSTTLASISHDGGATFDSLTLKNKLSADSGGTSQNTYSLGDLLQGNSSSTLSKVTVGAMGRLLSADTVAGIKWVVGITSPDVNAGVFAEARGGTGRGTYTKGDLLGGSGTNVLGILAIGAMGQILSVDTAATTGVKWVAAPSGVPSGASNAIQFNSASAFGGDDAFIWSPTPNTLSISRDTGQVGFAIIISSDTGAILANMSHDGGASFNSLTLKNRLSEDSGGTGNSTYTKGDLLGGSATNILSKLAIGSMGQVLSVDTAATTGFKWVASPAGGSGTVSSATVPNIAFYTGTTTVAGDNAFSWNNDVNRLGISRDVNQTGLAFIISSDTGSILSSISHDGGMTANSLTLANKLSPDSGGTGQSIYSAKGDILASTGTTILSKLVVGSNGTVLSADSSQATGLIYATVKQHKTFINFPVQSAKLSSDGGCRIDGGSTPYPFWRLLFQSQDSSGGTGANVAMWQGRLDDNWQGGALTAKVEYLMISSDSDLPANGQVGWGVSIWAVTSGDGVSMITESYATENTASQGGPTTISADETISVPITNTDSLAAGDWYIVKLRRMNALAKAMTGDAAVISFAMTE